ncbi:MAG: hypothetical protein GXO70_06665 [Acidobacteria bacterium]|nr:hypothetical protein [Acidobacteriota bacterium]
MITLAKKSILASKVQDITPDMDWTGKGFKGMVSLIAFVAETGACTGSWFRVYQSDALLLVHVRVQKCLTQGAGGSDTDLGYLILLARRYSLFYNVFMDLKALAAAFFVAFITVIMDAVFNFHYIYVLAILVITCYVLVRLISIINKEPQTPSAPAPATGKPANLSSMLRDAAKSAKITLEMEPDMEVTVVVDEKTFRDALASGFQALGMKTHGRITSVRSGKLKLVHLILTVNRKAGTIQKELDNAVSTLRVLVSIGKGTAWQTDIPRKTELHILIPGN